MKVENLDTRIRPLFVNPVTYFDDDPLATSYNAYTR